LRPAIATQVVSLPWMYRCGFSLSGHAISILVVVHRQQLGRLLCELGLTDRRWLAGWMPTTARSPLVTVGGD
jgi:hypothetical protein